MVEQSCPRNLWLTFQITFVGGQQRWNSIHSNLSKKKVLKKRTKKKVLKDCLIGFSKRVSRWMVGCVIKKITFFFVLESKPKTAPIFKLFHFFFFSVSNEHHHIIFQRSRKDQHPFILSLQKCQLKGKI